MQLCIKNMPSEIYKIEKNSFLSRRTTSCTVGFCDLKFSQQNESIILQSLFLFPSLIVKLLIFLQRPVRGIKPNVSLPHGCIFICSLGVTATHPVLSPVIQQKPSASALTSPRQKVVRAGTQDVFGQ